MKKQRINKKQKKALIKALLQIAASEILLISIFLIYFIKGV